MRPLSLEESWILILGILALDIGCVLYGVWYAGKRHKHKWFERMKGE